MIKKIWEKIKEKRKVYDIYDIIFVLGTYDEWMENEEDLKLIADNEELIDDGGIITMDDLPPRNIRVWDTFAMEDEKAIPLKYIGTLSTGEKVYKMI